MKTQKSRLLLLILPLFIFTIWSCDNNDDDISLQGQMTAIVGGNTWKATTVSAGALQGRFSISGVANDGSTISLSLDGFEVDEYFSQSGSSNACVWQPTTGALGFVSHALGGFGKVEIEAINEQDSLVSGTFIFMGQEPSSGDTVSVVEGVFTDVRFYLEAVTIGDNLLKTKIDGSLWEADQVTGYASGSSLIINGTNASVTKTVSFKIPANISEGTYDMGSPFSSDYSGTYIFNGQTSLTSDSGTLKITNHDKLNKIIEGTFNFEASEFLGSGEASLTEGSFYVTY